MENLKCVNCQFRKECQHAIEDFDDSDLEYIWELWQLCRTQMRYSFGGVAGLDYPAVFQTVAIYGYEITPYDLSGLQSMENDLLKAQVEDIPKNDERKQ